MSSTAQLSENMMKKCHDDSRPVRHSVHLPPVLQPAHPGVAEGVGEDLHGVALDDLHATALLGHDDHHQEQQRNPDIPENIFLS